MGDSRPRSAGGRCSTRWPRGPGGGSYQRPLGIAVRGQVVL